MELQLHNSPFNEYSGLISFRIDWFDLLAVQGTLKSFFSNTQFKNINSLALSLLYGSTLTSIYDYWKNQSKVMSLLFNTLSRLRLLNWVISNMTLLFSYLENPCRESHRVKIASCHTSQMAYARQHGYINYVCFIYNVILPCAKSVQSNPTP